MKTGGLNLTGVVSEARPEDINKRLKAVQYDFQKPFQSPFALSGIPATPLKAFDSEKHKPSSK
jgi:hypothetical protein